MGYQSTHPGYTVRVDGIGLGPSRFAIHASVQYESQLTPPERERIVPQAQIELLLAVVGEWEHAIRLGARNVRIAVLGDGHLDRFFRNWVQGQQPPLDSGAERRSAPRSVPSWLQAPLTPE